MNKKDHTRKPVIRDPLPEKDWITLCEIVTWRAIGKAWPARRLKGLMKRNRGRKPAFLWASFERAAATVVSLCRKNDLSPYGSVDGNPHKPFPEGYFLSDVYADYVSDSIGPDLLAWPRAGLYPDEYDEEPKELPIYRGVRFFRSDVLSTSGQAGQPAAETAQAPAGGAQDDAALALEMVSARGTDRLKPATSVVPPVPAIPAQAVASTAPVFIKKGVEPPDTTTSGVNSKVGGKAKRTFLTTDIDAEYAERVDEHRTRTGRRPTFEADDEWRKNKGLTCERLRKLRKQHRTEEERKGGRPPRS